MDHTGLHTHRLSDNPEEARFAEAWRRMQAGSTLAWLLTVGSPRGWPVPSNPSAEVVAATVIQWLGSPVGRGFLADLGYVKKPETMGTAQEEKES